VLYYPIYIFNNSLTKRISSQYEQDQSTGACFCREAIAPVFQTPSAHEISTTEPVEMRTLIFHILPYSFQILGVKCTVLEASHYRRQLEIEANIKRKHVFRERNSGTDRGLTFSANTVRVVSCAKGSATHIPHWHPVHRRPSPRGTSRRRTDGSCRS
jgi:hypothetical protein